MKSKTDIRRDDILELLSKNAISSTQYLAEMLNVSSETIRKDLDLLSSKGKIIKVHGGAALASSLNNELPFDLRSTSHLSEKISIAKAAIQLINPMDSIILESCTTVLELARLMLEQPELLETLVIVTNSLSIVSLFDSGKKCKRLFFIGGWINPNQHNAYGNQAANALKAFKVNKAFLSGVALSNDYVLSAYYEEDALFQRAVISSANQVFLLMDHSKFFKSSVISVSDLSDIDYLISDIKLTALEKEKLKSDLNICFIQV